MEDNNETEQKPTATKWTCSECGQKLTLYVAPSVVPTCTNPEVHPKKTIKMLPVTKR